MRLATVYEDEKVSRRNITEGKTSRKEKKPMPCRPLLSRALKVTVCSLFYLVAVLKQHSCSWELVDGVKIEGTRGRIVRSLWDFLKNKKY